jgi:hypothetical protein
MIAGEMRERMAVPDKPMGVSENGLKLGYEIEAPGGWTQYDICRIRYCWIEL